MANPFRTPIRTPNNNFGNLQQLYQMMTSSRNPMQLLEQMAQNNSQLSPIVNALRGGANPKSVFESLCKQRGINPTDFLRNITGKNI